MTFEEDGPPCDRRRSDPGDILLPSLNSRADFGFGILAFGGIYEADVVQFRGPPPLLVTDSLSNLEIAVIGADSDGSRGRVVVRLTATELGSFSAVFKLLSTDLSAGVQQAGVGSLEVEVHGNVMSREKGTPQVHGHIRRVGTYTSTTSDMDEGQ